MGLGSEPQDGDYWAEKLGWSLCPVDRSIFSTVVFRNSSMSFVDEALDAALRSSQISLYSHANVVELRSQRSAEVTAARVQTRDGGTFHVEGAVFVLAGGAVQNARLLLASGDANAGGLGNEADVVGRYFMEHPNLDHGALHWEGSLAPSPLWASPFRLKGIPMKPVLELTPDYQEEHELLNFSLYFRPVTTYRRKLASLAGFRTPAAARYGLHVRFEMAPSPASRITLGPHRDRLGMRKPHVHAEMGALEHRTLQHVSDAVTKELVDRKIGRIDVAPLRGRAWETRVSYQHHLLGGTRMHADPRLGVVDPNCRVHTLRNLYISGSSVFPTGGHANPTLTIVAMAHRLAEHLAANDRVHGAGN
jgi:choline dehydrogenase-like flavoprotein